MSRKMTGIRMSAGWTRILPRNTNCIIILPRNTNIRLCHSISQITLHILRTKTTEHLFLFPVFHIWQAGGPRLFSQVFGLLLFPVEGAPEWNQRVAWLGVTDSLTGRACPCRDATGLVSVVGHIGCRGALTVHST